MGSKMKTKISQICKDIEREEKVKILFAVENGSRNWNISSKDSDYDVRFVFVRPLKEYIQINKRDEVILRHFNKEGIKISPEGCFIDVCGFDVHKFTRMLWDSNPQVIEWLTSNIVYYGRQNKVFLNFAKNNFKPISLYFHYKSMCRQNYMKYLKSGNLVTYKKYLYVMRGLVNAKYVVFKKELPTTDFVKTLKQAYFIPADIQIKLKEIIGLKKEGKEKEIIQNITKIDYYIEEFLKNDDEAPKEKQLATPNEIDKELRRIVIK